MSRVVLAALLKGSVSGASSKRRFLGLFCSLDVEEEGPTSRRCLRELIGGEIQMDRTEKPMPINRRSKNKSKSDVLFHNVVLFTRKILAIVYAHPCGQSNGTTKEVTDRDKHRGMDDASSRFSIECSPLNASQ